MQPLQIYDGRLDLNQKMTSKTLMTTKNIALKILKIMEHHIGFERGINRQHLFRKVYALDFKGDLGDFVRWEFIKRAMSYIRKHSKAFIVFEKVGTEYIYFVVKDKGDEKYYCDFLTRTIKKMEQSKKRVKRAIEEKWYYQHWELDTNKKKLIK